MTLLRITAVLIALCAGQAAVAGVVDDYKRDSFQWKDIQSDLKSIKTLGENHFSNYCTLAKSYDALVTEINDALKAGRLILLQDKVRFVDLSAQDRKDLEILQASVSFDYRDADRRCRR